MSISILQDMSSVLQFSSPCRNMIPVAQSGELLMVVPWDLKTYELCVAAVKQNGSILVCVPKQLRIFEMIKAPNQ